jgi:hypothetical protein
MRVKFLIASLGLVVGLAFGSTAVNAASMVATPSSGSGAQVVDIALVLGPGEAFDNFQYGIGLSDGGTGQDIFTVTVTANIACPGGWTCFPGQVVGGNSVNGGGFSFGGNINTSADLVQITLTPTGASGTLNLVLGTGNTAQLTFVDIAGSPFSGTIASFTAGGAPIPEPGSMILMGAGLAVAGLVGRKAFRS